MHDLYDPVPSMWSPVATSKKVRATVLGDETAKNGAPPPVLSLIRPPNKAKREREGPLSSVPEAVILFFSTTRQSE